MKHNEWTMDYMCECASICSLTLTVNREKAKQMIEGKVILDGCKRGPEATDILIAKRDGYTHFML